jgi:hypothetical protein
MTTISHSAGDLGWRQQPFCHSGYRTGCRRLNDKDGFEGDRSDGNAGQRHTEKLENGPLMSSP